MPAKKKKNNKPKSAKTMSQQNITIHHSSPTFQHQEKEQHLRAFSMEDEGKEVVVETVKALEIGDDSNNPKPEPEPEPEPEPVTETKREVAILEDIIDKAEKILDREEDGSSSSSSSDDEKEEADSAVVCEPEKEDKVEEEPSLVVDAIPSVVEDPIPTVETELVKPPSNKAEEEAVDVSSSSQVIDIVDQKRDEVQETEESKVVVDEAPIENPDTSNPNPPCDEAGVNKEDLSQPSSSSWKSCCGIFDLIRL